MIRFITKYLIILTFISFWLRAEDEVPKVNINAYAKLKNGQNVPVVEITINEYLTTKTFALLNYIFFDESSSEIPSKYIKFRNFEQSKRFEPERQLINWDMLDVYYNILNIIGYRLTKYPEETISLLGCISQNGNERNNKNLGNLRSQSVKSYLIDIWKIDSSRIKILASQGFPPKPSSSKDNPQKSSEENQRVEIYGNWNILKPLVVNDTQRVTSPPALIFQTKVISSSPVLDWNLNITQKIDSVIKKFFSHGEVPDEIIWVIEKNKVPVANIPIKYQIFVNSGLSGKSRLASIPVKEITIVTKKRLKIKSSEFARYNLILFDFGKSDISEENLKIVQMIKDNENLNDSTKIFLTGYTDALGDSLHNIKLSFERATNASKLFLNIGLNEQQLTIRGLGNSTSPYFNSAIDELIVNQGQYLDPNLFAQDETKKSTQNIDFNTTPEGRYYLRTVIIELEKKVNY